MKWRQGANKECRHPLYENVRILAVACDGKAECWNDEDEKNCKRDEIEILLGQRNSVLFSSIFQLHC